MLIRQSLSAIIASACSIRRNASTLSLMTDKTKAKTESIVFLCIYLNFQLTMLGVQINITFDTVGKAI
jgi:hypothetical protein